MDEMVKNWATDMLIILGDKKALTAFGKHQAHAFDMYQDAEAYRKYAIKRRGSKEIAASLKEARPMLEIKESDLDMDGCFKSLMK